MGRGAKLLDVFDIILDHINVTKLADAGPRVITGETPEETYKYYLNYLDKTTGETSRMFERRIRKYKKERDLLYSH